MSTLPKVVLIGGPDVHRRLELMNQLKDAFKISVFGSNPQIANRFADAGFKYHTYSLSRRVNMARDMRGVIEMAALLRRIRPQMVHTFATKPCIWGRIAASLANVPLIIGTLPGLGCLYANNDLSTRLIRTMYQPLQKFACRVSDLTIFQNNDDFSQFVTGGVVPAEKATIVAGSGVPTDVFDPATISESAKTRLRDELGIQPSEIVVTMIARINRSKGVFEFMAAADSVRKQYPQVRFLLVGPANRGIDSLSPHELQKLEESVLWPGPRQDIPTVLAISEVFVLPSAYREGIPRVLLEAAAMGLPLITTDSPGCNDVVIDGVNGFLVPTHDAAAIGRAVTHLLETPEVRQKFGVMSRRRVLEHFSLSIVTHRTQSIYQEQLAHKGLLQLRVK